MPGEIGQVAYVSQESGKIKESDLSAILDVARRNNLANDISGLLVFKGGIFVQLLEGPPEKLEQLLANIKNDNRHSRVNIVHSDMVSARSFADWTMAYIGGAEITAEWLNTILQMTKEDEVFTVDHIISLRHQALS